MKLKSGLGKILKNMSLQSKISFSLYVTVMALFVVNVIIFFFIGKEMKSFDNVYSSNEYNTSYLEKLNIVQNNLKDYILTKSTESMEQYYVNVEQLRLYSGEMNYDMYDADIYVMQQDVVSMTNEYINLAEEAIQNKRGRNVLKYKDSYENADAMYRYLRDYVSALNDIQFQLNTANYEMTKRLIHLTEIYCVCIMVIVTGICFMLLRYITRLITTPLSQLVKEATEVSDGNFNVEIVQPDTNDEIRVLSESFSTMITNINKYMENEKRTMEEKREISERELKMEARFKDAELRYYQSQMDPHFLFNTLNAGMQLAMLEGAPRTSEYVENVAKFFRYNLKKDNGISTLKDEIALVDYYMAILDVRFGGDIKLKKEIDEKYLHVDMPKMTLQPMIENAVNHGIHDIEGSKMVYLSVYTEGGDILVSVADGGKGMSKQLIESIMDGTYQNADGKSNGVALINIISRLKLFYKREDVVTITSEGEGTGTEILIRIPAE